jgi:hypothetical protein
LGWRSRPNPTGSVAGIKVCLSGEPAIGRLFGFAFRKELKQVEVDPTVNIVVKLDIGTIGTIVPLLFVNVRKDLASGEAKSNST